MKDTLYLLVCISYSTTISTLWCAICYVYYGVLTNKYREWNNAFLNDDNLEWALLIPIAWQVQVCLRYYIFNKEFNYIDYPLERLAFELGCEFVDVIATIATTILFTGIYKRK
jgi:hypothetical protein